MRKGNWFSCSWQIAGNGFGKLAGVTQVKELGNIETPILLTNTLSVAQGIEGVLNYTLNQPGNENVRSVNAIVGETNDGGLNDIRGRHVKADDVVVLTVSGRGDKDVETYLKNKELAGEYGRF